MSDSVEACEEQTQHVETKKALDACNDYLRMGVGRSLAKLARRYNEETSSEPPTKSLRWLAEWSRRFDWQERADAYDKAINDEKEQRRREIMESGFALDYERVAELKRMAMFLSEQIYKQDASGVYANVWLSDVKQVGGERVNIERFNGEIFSQLRGALDDLAKETGGRKQKTELTGKDGEPLPTSNLPSVVVVLPDNGRSKGD